MSNVFVWIALMAGLSAAADTQTTYTGTITDSMCVMNHKMMIMISVFLSGPVRRFVLAHP